MKAEDFVTFQAFIPATRRRRFIASSHRLGLPFLPQTAGLPAPRFRCARRIPDAVLHAPPAWRTPGALIATSALARWLRAARSLINTFDDIWIY